MFPSTATIFSPGHTFVRVRGAGALKFLQDTTTQDLSEGASALSCLLDGTGHVLGFFRVIPLGDEVMLDGSPACHEALTGWLARVAPLSGCEVIDETDRWRLTMIRGERAEFSVKDPPRDFSVRGEDIIARVSWGIPGIDVLTPTSIPAQSMDAELFDAWRVKAGMPVYGIDVTADHIVNETPYLALAVADGKGCYPGQETVAKIRNLGRARRAVVGLRFEAPAPHPGTEITLDGQKVGTITSSGFDAAIATVRSEALAAGQVVAGDRPAQVFPLA